MPRFEKWLIGVAASAPVDQAAHKALKVRLGAVLHFLGAALTSSDEAEDVHQLRVWTRRADAALRLFKRAIAGANRRKMQKLLRNLRHKAGALRDCDVHRERLEARDQQVPKRIAKSLDTERRKARRKLQTLRRRLRKDDRLETHCEKLLEKVAWPKRHSSRASPPFAAWCRQELAPIAARFFELADGNLKDDQSLHALRIAGKQLRYALELSIAALQANDCRRLYEELSAVQDRLGEVCDRISAVQHVRAWQNDDKKSKRSHKLRLLLAVEERGLDTARKQLLRWWTPARRARLKRRWNACLRTSAGRTDE